MIIYIWQKLVWQHEDNNLRQIYLFIKLIIKKKLHKWIFYPSFVFLRIAFVATNQLTGLNQNNLLMIFVQLWGNDEWLIFFVNYYDSMIVFFELEWWNFVTGLLKLNVKAIFKLP